MSEMMFVEKVKKYFGFLESEYKFKPIMSNNSQIRPYTDGVVEYRSDTTVVVIDSETGFPSLWFYRIKDGKKYYLDPVSIHEYLSTNDTEKRLLLSTNPGDQPAASALANQKFLLNQPEWKGTKGTPEDLEKDLANFSKWLKEYANLCLKADFSHWPDLFEYKILRARADHLRRGKDEMVLAQVKGADGKYTLVKQPMFKDKLDYALRLRNEIGR